MPNLSPLSDGDKALSDLSPKDKPWEIHRKQVSRISDLYSQSGYSRYSQRLSDCSRALEFALVASAEGDINLKLFAARFCRVKFCPVCQWRRSLMWVARMCEALPKLLADKPTHEFIFLTLTVRNCDLDELRSFVTWMNKSWQRLSQLKKFPAVGFLKSLEVTRSKDGLCHPHFHCLLVVPSTYFIGRNYLSQKKWAELWQQCLRVDYEPVVDVRKVYAKKEKTLIDAVRETCKYSVKPSDLMADSDWLAGITEQLHKTRSVSVGGILKDYLKEDDPEDLISENLDKDSNDEIMQTLVFGWREMVAKYLLKT